MLPTLSPAVNAVLPAGTGFLREYAAYAAGCSDAPDLYHVGVGATILGTIISRRVSCPWLAGRTLVPNMYTLLVGPSRSTRKTASMDAGLDILREVDSTLVMPVPGSYEELIAQIRTKSEGLLTYREFGHFLKTTARGYGEPIRTVLMDLFDWPPGKPYTRNLKKGKTVIDGPICLSMLSSIATDLLYAYSDVEEWTGGFFGRMTILYGARDTFKMPSTWEPYRAHLIQKLAEYNKFDYQPSGGFEPSAWSYFDTWSRWRDSQTSRLPLRVQTFAAGVSTLAAKIALIFAVDAGECQCGPGWLVSLRTMQHATEFIEKLYMPSIEYLGENLALSVWERDRKKVLDAIDSQGQLGVARRDLLKRALVSAELLDMVIGTLREEGTVAQGNDARGIVYKRTTANDTAVILPFARPQNAANQHFGQNEP